jgi:hypothetical protein
VTPVRFIFGLHVHQPVGNFDHVFEEHARDVYLPFLTRLAERECLPLVLHISGPLLEWLEAHGHPYLDLVGRLVADGHVELLLSGMYEPVLAALPRADRVEQIQWMREAVRTRFGVTPTGLWLTERVWEPDLPSDLRAAGVQYTLVDDRHFLVSGFRADQLHTHYVTEASADRVVLFPIHERLRYLVPFRPVVELERYFLELQASGRALAVLADDGEKFGGWPGTREWVYGQGWLDAFLDTLDRLRHDGVIELSMCDDARRMVASGGLAYLPTASYREMETWALPAEPARRLTMLERELGTRRMAGPDGAFVRGGHWRNFLVKYPEANRAHKCMLALSALTRERGDPLAARRAVARAQCNDAYWHGVFGGLYLPHLRAAVWAQLALAEGELRRGEGLVAETLDLDGDGELEVWIHSSRFSAIIAPHRGAGIETYTVFAAGVNYADTLTRRVEAYHEPPVAASADAPASDPDSGGARSIHELEQARRATGSLARDAETRALFLERVLPGDLDRPTYESGLYQPVLQWADSRFAFVIRTMPAAVEVVCTAGEFEKRLRFTENATVTATYRWTGSGRTPGSRFTAELSVAGVCTIDASPGADRWIHGIETVAQSERGIERTRQGESTTIIWDLESHSQALGGEGLTVTVRPG